MEKYGRAYAMETENIAVKYLNNAYGHFKTITRHKLLVMHYCFKAGLIKQGLLHDLSKYAPVEFMVGVLLF